MESKFPSLSSPLNTLHRYTNNLKQKTSIMSLTPNAILTAFHMARSADNPSFSPTVQVIYLKKIDMIIRVPMMRGGRAVLDICYYFRCLCATLVCDNYCVHIIIRLVYFNGAPLMVATS